MILTILAFFILHMKSQLADHKVLFGAFVVLSLIGWIVKGIIRQGTQRWPDGQIDSSKSSPLIYPAGTVYSYIFLVRIGLFIWICVAAWH